MNYGLYLSASGLLTSMHRQDVMANNLANVNTVGFKADEVTTIARLPERLESGAAGTMSGFGAATAGDAQQLLERLGGGQFIAPSRVNLRPGTLEATGNDLDVAILGEGFFVVDASRGGSRSQPRLTRDGRFTLNAQGELTLASNGCRVLDRESKPIVLSTNAPVTIDARGGITQRGALVASLRFISPRDPASLSREGDNMFRCAEGLPDADARTPKGAIRQGHVEASAVDPIAALTAMINASKAVQANATLMQYHDNILGQAINTFGRVA